VRAAAEVLHPRRIRDVDARVSGDGPRALAGALTIGAGADAENIAAFSGIFDRLDGSAFFSGGWAGQVAKIVNNILCQANFTRTTEAFRLGLPHDLTPDTASP
jgi:2-hydroxy-3-oxopropionate reductase